MLREMCLRFFILVLVFILSEKTGNFFVIFWNLFSTFHKKTNEDLCTKSETQFPP